MHCGVREPHPDCQLLRMQKSVSTNYCLLTSQCVLRGSGGLGGGYDGRALDR